MRNTYGHSPRVVRDMADDVRNMYAAIPGAPMDDFMVRLNPLASGEVPERLEAVRSDDFGGELILDFPTVCGSGPERDSCCSARAIATDPVRTRTSCAREKSRSRPPSGARRGVCPHCEDLASFARGWPFQARTPRASEILE